jgi:hypothetical protein
VSISSYTTSSGSVYEVDYNNKRVRSRARAPSSTSRRLASDWRTFEKINWAGLGHPLWFWWGGGRDEFSPGAIQLGTDGAPDEAVTRATHTSPVVSREEVELVDP